MEAITCYTPVYMIKTGENKSSSDNKKYRTCESYSCSDKARAVNDLMFASMFIDLMSATVKQLGKQVKSLKKENTELREKLENQESKDIDLVA
jgi:hypothetical protein